MKPFVFREFTVQQHKDVFRVGTDGVLLGALCSVHHGTRVLEVGPGTGLISLMIAQRNPQTTVVAVEINPEAAKIANDNFKNSKFHSRLEVIQDDYKSFESPNKFKLIVSNPPYFETNSSEKDAIARQQRELSFENLIKKSKSLLSSDGIFSVIIPHSSAEYFTELCNRRGLILSHSINIYGSETLPPKRAILEFGFQGKELIEEKFVIEDAPRVYSRQYLEATKDFHVFKEGSTLVR